MELLLRGLTFYAWYAAAVAVVFSIVLALLYLASAVRRWVSQREFEFLQALRRRSGT